MDTEKRSSKGGFLQLFDWNVKSRKKLFSNKSELPEGTKQGNEDFANSLTLRPPFLEVRENGPGPRSKRTIDYNSASSVTGDDEYGTKAPGVVARLMGLDSLPTSEPCSIPFYESSFVRDSFSRRSTLNFQIEHHIINSLPSDEISRNLAEYRLHKVQSRPIERFQTETLPPKSAKSIPITRHRLLSPIKSPGFIPRNNVTYVMEAAAKMIEQGPPSTPKGKMPCVRSSSVPLRIRDLREKMDVPIAYGPEASRRPKEPISRKYSSGQDIGKNHSGSGDTKLYNASVASRKDSSDSLKNKGKSASLAVQAKVNVQRKEGPTSSGNRSSVNQKEGGEIKLDLLNKSQTSTQKKVQKRPSTSKTSDVLKQNNQKQNGVANKDKVALKASVSNLKERKVPSSNGSVRSNKASNKVINTTNGSRKMNYVAKDTGNELLSSKRKTSPENKLSVHMDIPFEGIIAKNASTSTSERSVKWNVSNDGRLNWDVVDRKSNMDVVSFTFTSPVKRSAPGSQTSSQLMDRDSRLGVDPCVNSGPSDLKSPTSSSLSLNIIGNDSLSVLLEQKLKELAFMVDSSNNLVNDGSACSASSSQDSRSTLNVTNTTTMESCNELQLHRDELGHPYDANYASVDGLLLKAKQKLQELEVIQGQSTSSNNSDYGEDLHYRFHSSISNHEPSCSDRSYESSESKISSIANGSRQSLSAEAYGVGDSVSATKCQRVEIETELSDSASSTSVACRSGNNSSTPFSSTYSKKSSKWEVDYIAEVLNNSDLSVEDFVFGRIKKAITPNLFDQLENRFAGCEENAEEDCILWRKILFDYVGENLELRGERLISGSCKSWSKWEILFRRKVYLAEDLYREISSWTSLGEVMVDELVDKDMSSGQGKWVDFETEAFEEGVEIEKMILTSLVDELVADMLM